MNDGPFSESKFLTVHEHPHEVNAPIRDLIAQLGGRCRACGAGAESLKVISTARLSPTYACMCRECSSNSGWQQGPKNAVIVFLQDNKSASLWNTIRSIFVKH